MMNCDKVKDGKKEVLAQCPISPWTHSSGIDRNPSFSIRPSINVTSNSGATAYSVGFCFTCGLKGSALSIAKKYHENSGDISPVDYVTEVEVVGMTTNGFKKSNIQMGYRVLSKMKFGKKYKESKKISDKDLGIIDWKEIEKYMGSVPKYILDRGISVDTCKAFKLGHDKERSSLVIPFVDKDGRLCGYTLRRYNSTKNQYYRGRLGRYFHSPGMKKSYILYGENNIRSNIPDLVIVEGNVDVLKLWQFGYNALAVQGSHSSEFQIDRMLGFVGDGGKIFIMADGDDAGVKLAKDLSEKIGKRCYTKVVFIERGLDPGDLKDRDEAIKYLGDCRYEQ